MALPIIEPAVAAPAAPAVQSTPAPPPAAPVAAQEAPAAPTELPEGVLRIPAFQAILAGTPPAVSMPLKGADERPDVKILSENKDALTGNGIGFYRSLGGELGVMFNSMRIHLQDLQAADRQGKLQTVAPDFDLVNHEVAKMGANHPIHSATPPAGPATPVSMAPPQSPSGQLPLMPPPAAAVQRKLAQQRVMNLQPGSPTSGPSPGAGRLLNSVLKGVV